MSDWVAHAIDGDICGFDAVGVHSGEAILSIRNETPQSHAVMVFSPIRFKTLLGDNQHEGSLSALIDDAVRHDERIWSRLERLFQDRSGVIEALVSPQHRSGLQAMVKKGFSEIEDILKAVWLIHEASSSARTYIDRIELLWVLEAYRLGLEAGGYHTLVIDSSEVMRAHRGVSDSALERTVDVEASGRAARRLLERHPACDTLLVAGGWAAVDHGPVTELGPDSHEMAASVFGAACKASQVTIWNIRDMVMTADIDEVPSASIIDEITYAEATELSYFGAKVLHPHAMVPAIAQNIPIYMRSLSDLHHPGTRVSSVRTPGRHGMVKGFSAIHQTALVNIEGAGMIGVPGISSRLFAALREAGISVILISQASSEHSICFAIPQDQAPIAEMTIRRAFADELADYRIQSVEVEAGCAILAAVGEEMPGVPGIAAKFFGALGKASVNVRAIAQGSSERNISAVIKGSDSTRALRALHAGFFLSNQALSIGILGPGLIGSTLIEQMSRESERLKSEFGVDLRVRGIANSRSMLIDDQGISLATWKERFEAEQVPLDIEVFTDHVNAEYFPHAVLIDCSTSSALPQRYVDWISCGIHIITPNKKAGTSEISYYQELMSQGRRRGKHFLYETTVGAGLPIINTLKDLIQTGDRIRRIEGVFSGTLGYLFWRFDGSVPFSELVKEAKAMGYTEPDPRDDLSGMDIVRKTVILAREMGLTPEVEDVPVLNLIPMALREVAPEDFMTNLHKMDDEMLVRLQAAQEAGQLLKYVGVIEADGTCSVELKGYPTDHPFARISGTDNIVAFTTDRYHTQPLVIQGPGAGPAVTAGGVFADLLRLSAYLGARF